MADIHKYIIKAVDDRQLTNCEYDTLAEAVEIASQVPGPTAVVENVYRFDDSELVWTSTGDEQWPPNNTNDWK